MHLDRNLEKRQIEKQHWWKKNCKKYTLYEVCLGMAAISILFLRTVANSVQSSVLFVVCVYLLWQIFLPLFKK